MSQDLNQIPHNTAKVDRLLQSDSFCDSDYFQDGVPADLGQILEYDLNSQIFSVQDGNNRPTSENINPSRDQVHPNSLEQFNDIDMTWSALTPMESVSSDTNWNSINTNERDGTPSTFGTDFDFFAQEVDMSDYICSPQELDEILSGISPDCLSLPTPLPFVNTQHTSESHLPSPADSQLEDPLLEMPDTFLGREENVDKYDLSYKSLYGNTETMNDPHRHMITDLHTQSNENTLHIKQEINLSEPSSNIIQHTQSLLENFTAPQDIQDPPKLKSRKKNKARQAAPRKYSRKPHICKHCGDKIVHIRDYEQHLADEHDDPQYACEECKQPFSRYDNLKQHWTTSKHLDNGSKTSSKDDISHSTPKNSRITKRRVKKTLKPSSRLFSEDLDDEIPESQDTGEIASNDILLSKYKNLLIENADIKSQLAEKDIRILELESQLKKPGKGRRSKKL